MKMRLSNVAASGVALVFCLAYSAGYAQDMGGLGNKLGGMMPGSSMQSGSMGNVAGLLQYCVKNNYLGGASGASGIQNQLLGKMQGQSSAPPTNDPGYRVARRASFKAATARPWICPVSAADRAT
jgi:hypothetical protein